MGYNNGYDDGYYDAIAHLTPCLAKTVKREDLEKVKKIVVSETATQQDLRKALTELLNILQKASKAVAIACAFWLGIAQADDVHTNTWETVPPNKVVRDVVGPAIDEKLLDEANEELAALLNKDFLDGEDAEDENVAVAIGEGAKAGVTDEAIQNTGLTHMRSAGVAIGAHAEVRNDTEPAKVQGVAIGWHARATEINALAIGSGAQHSTETESGGDATVAAGVKAIALGYGAKSCTTNAVQIGEGRNSTANSLQFLDVPIVKDGRLAVDETVAEDAAKIMETNRYARGSFTEESSYKEARIDWQDPEENLFSLRLRNVTDPDDPVALEWSMGEDQVVQVYRVDTIDEITNKIWSAIFDINGKTPEDYPYPPVENQGEGNDRR